MNKYRSKCRWNMLLHIDGEIVEIRPGELFESRSKIKSRYLELLNKNSITINKKSKTKKKVSVVTFKKGEISGSSST